MVDKSEAVGLRMQPMKAKSTYWQPIGKALTDATPGLHQFIVSDFTDHYPASYFRGILQYTLNQWDKIPHSISQGVMEIETSEVENMIHPTKPVMKN